MWPYRQASATSATIQSAPPPASSDAVPASAEPITLRDALMHTTPLSTSNRSVAAATLGPATRRAFVVPILPDPDLRISTCPMKRPKMRPKGMPQMK